MSYDYRGTRDRIYGIVRVKGADGREHVTVPNKNKASSTECALLAALVEFAPNIEPSVATLANMLGMDPRSIPRVLKSCQKKGLLKVEARPGLGKKATNRYTLLHPGQVVPRQIVTPDDLPPLTISTATPDNCCAGPPTDCHPKQITKADKEAEKESARARARKPKIALVEDPKATAEHAELTKLYFVRFEAARGVKPVFDSRDGKAIRDLLSACGVERAAQAIDGAFCSWWQDKITIRDVAANPSKFIGLKPQNTNARGARQPNGGGWKPVVEND